MPTFFSSKDTRLGPSRALLTYFLKVFVATTDKAKCAASFHGRCAYKVKGSIRDVVAEVDLIRIWKEGRWRRHYTWRSRSLSSQEKFRP